MGVVAGEHIPVSEFRGILGGEATMHAWDGRTYTRGTHVRLGLAASLSHNYYHGGVFIIMGDSMGTGNGAFLILVTVSWGSPLWF